MKFVNKSKRKLAKEELIMLSFNPCLRTRKVMEDG
jgi:hypothetical protein